MHISKEFLLEAVGLSLVVALILISMQVFQKAVKVTSLLEEGQEEQIMELEEYEIVKYDGLLIDGMTAVTYIKRMVENYDLQAKVQNVNGEFVLEKVSECKELRDIDSPRYICPMEKYYCEVVRDENKVIQEVRIAIVRGGD